MVTSMSRMKVLRWLLAFAVVLGGVVAGASTFGVDFVLVSLLWLGLVTVLLLVTLFIAREVMRGVVESYREKDIRG